MQYSSHYSADDRGREPVAARRSAFGFRSPGVRVTAGLVAALPSLGIAVPAFGQSATPGSTVALDPITVEGQSIAPADSAAARLAATPGGTDLVVTEDLAGTVNLTLSDALTTAPGVVIQDFFGANDQPRLQMRGSGLQQNPAERGVLFLRDGLPLNRADGSYVVGLADPRQAEFIEVNRGYTANRLGASVLGGALNLVSPTGSTAGGVGGSVEGGSFGHINVSARVGGMGETVDGFLVGSFTRRDGYRDYNQSDRIGVTGNLGVAVTDRISTRFFAGATDLFFEIPGPLPETLLEDDPTLIYGGPTVVNGRPVGPGPNVGRDRPQRETTHLRIGNRTTAAFDDHVVDFALGFAYTGDEFRFPISSGVRETDGGDLTVVGRYAYRPDADATLPLAELTAQATIGSAERRYFINEGGSRGPLLGEGDLEATTVTFTATGNVPLGKGVTLSPAVSITHATRDFDDTFGGATRPTIAFNPANPSVRLPDGAVPATDTSYSRDYTGVSPSLGLGWQATPDHYLFAAVSRSFEPPTHDDLIATVNGTPNSSPGRPNPGNPGLAADAFRTPDLDASTATTIEAGWRGRLLDRVGVDAVVYHSWVDNELLSLRDLTGASLGSVNADRTRHFGIELGADARLTETLTGRIAYTFQDFRFDDDPVRGDNHLAGAPPHVINAKLTYQVTPALAVETAIEARPDRTPVDNMNTVYADPFVTLDLRASYQPVEGVSVFGEVRNLFDETYAASTLIVDQLRPGQAAFLPGDGRAIYAGVSARF